MELKKRKDMRLQNFDYSSQGAYFITFCTKDKKKLLGHIVGEGLCALPSIKLTQIGKKVDEGINYINNNYTGVAVDKYVIMPNHIHLIIRLETGGDRTPPLRVCDIIGRFKSYTSYNYGEKLWQRSYYDHIIRGEMDYMEIWEYIDKNPHKWNEDELYLE